MYPSYTSLDQTLSTMLPSKVQSGFVRHVSACRRCRQRWERALQLDQLRSGIEREEPAPASIHGVERSPDVMYTSTLSPVGTLWIAVGPRGAVRIVSDEDEAIFCHIIEQAGHGIPEYMPGSLQAHVNQFAEYFAGRRTLFEMPVDLSRLGAFQRMVLEAVLAVPYGTVQSYRDIALAVDRPGAARAVGTVVANCPVSLVVPCHRIIRSDGTPGEYASRSLGSCGVQYKRMLLALEGVACGG